MPASVSMVDVRSLMISDVLYSPSLKVYEYVDDKSCFQQPYDQVTEETWAQSLVLSWRWGNIKPKLLAQDGSSVGGVAWFAARGAGARPEVRVDRLVMHAAIQLGHHGGDFAEDFFQ